MHSYARVSRPNGIAFDRDEETESSLPEHNAPPGERSTLKMYMQDIARVPLLTPQEEAALAERIQAGDAEARSHMIQANLRLVVKIAYDYAPFGLPLLDLISEGNIGLVKAVGRFDPEKGAKLSTYAAWWIRQAMKRALANQSKTIRLPVHLMDTLARIRATAREMAAELGRDPTDEELALALDVPVRKVAHLRSVSMRPSSLDAPVGEDGGTELGEIIGDDNMATPSEHLNQKSLINEINALIDRLERREAEIIRLRFGLCGDPPRTLESIGEGLGITRERVRQLQNTALIKMRRMLHSAEKQRTAEDIHRENRERARVAVLYEFFVERVQGKSRSA